MNQRVLALFSVLACCGNAVPVTAAVTVIRHLAGYQCMALSLSQSEMMNPSFVVPVLSEPSGNAPRLGVAGAVVAARYPTLKKNGFVEVLFPTGRTAWIVARFLKAWSPALGTNGTCSPALLSNGRLGFDYTR